MIGNKQKFISIVFLQGVYIIYSFNIIIAKLASMERVLSLKFDFLFMLELFMFGVYAILWQQVIKRLNLNTAYSSKGVVILWSMLWSWMFFGESVNINNIIGALLILIGIYLVMNDE